MRITEEQACIIRNVVENEFENDARIWLFGSRTDDGRRGGDVDLLIESRSPQCLLQCARVKMLLEQALQLPVDVVAKARDAEYVLNRLIDATNLLADEIGVDRTAPGSHAAESSRISIYTS